jgi:hypothetical protein
VAELAADGIDLRRADGSVHFWIARGWLDDMAVVRGKDTIVSSRPGRTARNRVKDFRRIMLSGRVQAATPAAFLALILELDDVWTAARAPWNLVAGDEYRGLAAGQTATIAVRTVNLIPAPALTEFGRNYSWELESVANPPEWTIAP